MLSMHVEFAFVGTAAHRRYNVFVVFLHDSFERCEVGFQFCGNSIDFLFPQQPSIYVVLYNRFMSK